MHLIHHIGFHDCVGGCNGCINFNNPDNMASVKLSAHLAIFTPVTTSKAMEQLWLTSGLWQLQLQSQLLSGPLIARGTMASLVHLSPALAREFYI